VTRAGQTPSQTVGPFFHLRLGGADEHRLWPREAPGALRLEGRVLDGEGQPVVDALVELWQADAEGRFCHPHDRWPRRAGDFTGFGRAATDSKTGRYAFETLRPGRVRASPRTPLQAPHLSLTLFARGLLGHLFTRVYFDDEVAANAEDPVLLRVRPDRRSTLVATRIDGEASEAAHREGRVYRHDLVLQGPDETVFFDV
jgi:protocatechuate 3,4-dioxygenase alpha subunit